MPELDLWTMVGGAGTLLGAVWGGIVYVNGRFDKKADKETVNQEFGEVKGELQTQRTTLGKVFDQIRENEQRAQDRHERLLERLPR